MPARPPGALQVLSESKSGVPKAHPDRNNPPTAEEEVFLVSTVQPPCFSPPPLCLGPPGRKSPPGGGLKHGGSQVI